MGPTWKVLKPVLDADNLYDPGFRLIKRKLPSAVDTDCSVTFVRTFVSLSWAPGKIPPLGSTTTPRMRPYNSSPLTVGDVRDANATTKLSIKNRTAVFRIKFFITP